MTLTSTSAALLCWRALELETILRRRQLAESAKRCFRTCITVDGVPFSGSPISRCTCSGITTVPDHHKTVTLARLFQQIAKNRASTWVPQKRQSAIAARRDEMQVACAVISFQAPRHASRVALQK